jgi:hypothetical protein
MTSRKCDREGVGKDKGRKNAKATRAVGLRMKGASAALVNKLLLVIYRQIYGCLTDRSNVSRGLSVSPTVSLGTRSMIGSVLSWWDDDLELKMFHSALRYITE